MHVCAGSQVALGLSCLVCLTLWLSLYVPLCRSVNQRAADTLTTPRCQQESAIIIQFTLSTHIIDVLHITHHTSPSFTSFS